MTWLIATLFAALFQSWRTAVQQRVRGSLSLNAAGLVRYFYGLPVAIALLAGWCWGTGQSLPDYNAPIWLWAILAGFAQIIGTNLLLMAFGYGNFVVGTAYAKTEAIQGAVLSMIFLHETLPALSWFGIAIGVFGVLFLATKGRKPRLSDFTQPATLCGLGAAFGFTWTSIFVKMSTQELHTTDMILAALVVLVVVQAGQVLMQGLYVAIREPQEIRRVLQTWRMSGLVGLLASLGSACWFTGFALAPVALVRTVGQAEVIFTLGFSRYYLGETIKRYEVLSLGLVSLGVILALWGIFAA